VEPHPASKTTQEPAPTAEDTGTTSAHPLRQWISRVFSRIEDIVYIGLGLLLAASALALLVAGGLQFGQGLIAGTLLDDIVALLDRILLILMIVEILYTVQVSFRERMLTAEPFLVIGLIAAMRRILILTAEFSEMLKIGASTFRNAMLELGMLTFLIIALVGSLYLFRKRHPAETVARE
jgi:hypothetical protein